MKKAITLLTFCFALLANAVAGIGDWNIFLAYHDATYNIPVGTTVYSLHSGNLLEYDTQTTEVRLYSKLTGLSDRNIACIGYSADCKNLVIVYDSGNIDLLGADGSVVNVPQLQSAASNLTVNQLWVEGSEAYIATSEGLARLDLVRGELRNFYNWGMSVHCAAVFDGKLFIGTAQDMRSCPLTSNLADPALWTVEINRPAVSMTVFAGALYYSLGTGLAGEPLTWGVWRYAKGADGTYLATQLTWLPYQKFSVGRDQAVISYDKNIAFINAATPTTLTGATTLDTDFNYLSLAADGTYWASNGTEGLQQCRMEGGRLVPQGGAVGGYGPEQDLCYYMRYDGNRLLLAGGRLDPFDLVHYDPMLAVYEDGEWRHFLKDGISAETGVPYRDLTCLVQAPADPTHHFASAGGTGLYEFKDFRFVRHYSQGNSTLHTAAADGSNPNYVRVDGLCYDAASNLWMVNSGVDTVLHVRRPDGTWKGIYCESLRKAPTLEKTLIDRDGRLWVASRRSADSYRGGLLCLDYNGTVDNTADDNAVFRSSVTNQDGTSYSLEGVYALAEDQDGAIWVGSAAGLFVVSYPEEWLASNFRITQIKVPRNDGTNYADYLLSGVAITAIAVDGANRKWIGTDESGLYLVSADGLETLQHFTAENSPLLSNCIYSIAPDEATGEVMIGTDKGLCSYMSDASAPLETLDKNQVKVYPNPVRPEYHGSVTVTGLTANADVKVTTTGGQVVAAGTSNGGTFQWDVRDLRGERVSAGVYFIMAATADGKKGVVARVVVI